MLTALGRSRLGPVEAAFAGRLRNAQDGVTEGMDASLGVHP